MRGRRQTSKRPGKRPRVPRAESSDAPTGRISDAVSQEELDRITRERDEALEQQAAIADVLRIISSAPGNLEPVFNAILENTTRICEAKLGTMFLCEGDTIRAVAVHGNSYYAELVSA